MRLCQKKMIEQIETPKKVEVDTGCQLCDLSNYTKRELSKKEAIERDIKKVKESINKARTTINSAEQEIQKLTKSLENLDRELEKCNKKPMIYFTNGESSEIVSYEKYNDEYIEFKTMDYVYKYFLKYNSDLYIYPRIPGMLQSINNVQNVFKRTVRGVNYWHDSIPVDHIELLKGVDKYEKNNMSICKLAPQKMYKSDNSI